MSQYVVVRVFSRWEFSCYIIHLYYILYFFCDGKMEHIRSAIINLNYWPDFLSNDVHVQCLIDLVWLLNILNKLLNFSSWHLCVLVTFFKEGLLFPEACYSHVLLVLSVVLVCSVQSLSMTSLANYNLLKCSVALCLSMPSKSDSQHVW